MKDLRPLLMMALLCLFACKKEQLPFDQLQLTDALEQTAAPLMQSPLAWQDKDLRLLDELANAQIIGLGEATHGTKEFFQAKHRIFQYMVENHGFRIFTIEADFGESIFINQAIQESRTEDIEKLMLEKMHFWTWRTEEVLALLVWMSEYNKNKPASEKLQYVGIDCQHNTFNPDLVKAYLEKHDTPFAEELTPLLTQIMTFDYNSPNKEEEVAIMLQSLTTAIDKFEQKQAALIASSSLMDYELHLRALEITKQVVKNDASSNDFRELYMAENTNWAAQYFGNEQVVCWAHNAHVAINEDYYGTDTGSMGYNLNRLIGQNYKAIGFTFNKGTFVAWGQNASGQSTGRAIQTYEEAPKTGSLNDVFGQSKEAVFMVELADLCENENWEKYFSDYPDLFWLGALYLVDNPQHHYYRFYKSHFDYLIHFDNTEASELLAQ